LRNLISDFAAKCARPFIKFKRLIARIESVWCCRDFVLAIPSESLGIMPGERLCILNGCYPSRLRIRSLLLREW